MGRPEPVQGQYWRTKTHATIRCKAYTCPPLPEAGGRWICTITPGTTLGPVETWLSSESYVTILVRGYWINVWCSTSPRGTPVHFAIPVPQQEVAGWATRGWEHY